MKKALLLLPCVMLLTACSSLTIGSRGARPIMLNAPQSQYNVENHITKDVSMCFNYTNNIDVSQAFTDEFKGRNSPDAAINTSIKIKGTVKDFFLNLVTLGIAMCRTAEVSADTIKYKN